MTTITNRTTVDTCNIVIAYPEIDIQFCNDGWYVVIDGKPLRDKKFFSNIVYYETLVYALDDLIIRNLITKSQYAEALLRE